LPVTPLHVGPGVVVCRLMGREYCAPVLAGSVLVDLEPGAVMLLGLEARLHGPLHTFAAALLLGGLAGLVGVLAARWLRIGFLPEPGWGVAWLGGAVGWALHVFLDSFLYTDITPFQPLTAGNPLLGLLGPHTTLIVYVASLAATVWGVAWIASWARPSQAGR